MIECFRGCAGEPYDADGRRFIIYNFDWSTQLTQFARSFEYRSANLRCKGLHTFLNPAAPPNNLSLCFSIESPPSDKGSLVLTLINWLIDGYPSCRIRHWKQTSAHPTTAPIPTPITGSRARPGNLTRYLQKNNTRNANVVEHSLYTKTIPCTTSTFSG